LIHCGDERIRIELRQKWKNVKEKKIEKKKSGNQEEGKYWTRMAILPFSARRVESFFLGGDIGGEGRRGLFLPPFHGTSFAGNKKTGASAAGGKRGGAVFAFLWAVFRYSQP